MVFFFKTRCTCVLHTESGDILYFGHGYGIVLGNVTFECEGRINHNKKWTNIWVMADEYPTLHLAF